MTSPRTNYQRCSTALLLVGVGAVASFGYVFLRAVQSPEVRRLLSVVAAQCLGRLGAAAGQLRPQHALGLGIPAVITVVFLWSLGRHVRATARLRSSLPTLPAEREPLAVRRACEQLGLPASAVKLLESPAPWCFCLGLARPKIFLSLAAVSRLRFDELTAVLAHERHHLRQRDPLRVALIAALQRALFFLPVIGTLQRSYAVAQEVAADEAALGLPGGKLALASAIGKLAPADGPAGSAAFAAARTLAARVAFLDGRPFLVGTITIAQVLASIAVVAGMLWYLTPPTLAQVRPAAVDCPGMGSGAPGTLPLDSASLLAQGQAAASAAPPPWCAEPACGSH